MFVLSGKLILSNSLEDYLEGILNLDERNETVRITDLARQLGIAKPSVTEAVKQLVNLGLLEHERYGPLELTPRGREYAGEIRHRHRVIKEFLVRVLGVKSAVAEEEACRMEHAMSPDTVSKMVVFLEAYIKRGAAMGKMAEYGE